MASASRISAAGPASASSKPAIPGATTLANGGGSSFASFLLGAADTGRTETIRYLQQIYPYYGFYAQDDWRINDKLVLNYGLRYEFTQPPRAGGDQYSDFSPTKPNPAVNNYPGALVFAGDGPGREGTSSLFPGYYGAIAPRVSFAYSANDKTIIRGGVGRSFGRVTVVQGSSHFAGFIGQYVFSSADAGVTPAFNLDQGLPAVSAAAADRSDVLEQQRRRLVQRSGGEPSGGLRQLDDFDPARSFGRGLTVELDYNGVYGSNLQAGLLNPNQVPMSVVNDLIARFGPTGARDLLNSQITSAAAVAAGIRVPYPNFTNPSVQRSRTVAQALRPYPQYLAVNVQSGGGDKTGRSHYHAGVVKVNQRMTGGLSLQSSYTYSKLMTDADSFSGSGARDGCRAARARVVGGPVRPDPHHQNQLGLRAAVRRGTALAANGHRQPDRRRLAHRPDPGLQQRAADRRDHQCPAQYLQRHQPAERHRRRGLARADRRRGVRPARRPVPEPGGVRPAGRRSWATRLASTGMCGASGT